MSYSNRLDLLERNLIVNGNFDLNQRYGLGGTATNAQLIGGNGYSLDRWKSAQVTAGASVSQNTDVPTFTQSGYNSVYCLKVAVTTATASPASGDLYQIRQVIEGYNYQQIHGKKARLQFWVKSNITGTYSVQLRNSAGDRTYISSYTIVASNTWEKKSIDFSLDTAGTWLFDNSSGLLVNFTLMAGSSFQSGTVNTWTGSDIRAVTGQANAFSSTSNTWQLSQVQLIPQDFTQAGASLVDIPFSRAGRNIGEELRACQRYCYAIIPTSANYPFAIGWADTTGSITALVNFPITMRVIPTLTSLGAASDYGYSNFSAGGSGTSLPVLSARTDKTACWIQMNASGLTQFRPYDIESQTTSSTLIFSAEL